MVMLITLLAALAVALSAPSPHHHHRPRRPMHASVSRASSAAALRRSISRMTQLAVLQRREALLHDLLVRANTETPLLRDGAAHEVLSGLFISATFVSRDFIGSPIIRATVMNRRPAVVSIVLIADLADAQGRTGRASSALVLQPHQTRTVELACPSELLPLSLRWSAIAL
ncbi:MAG: hypothetical protein JO098_05210 [Candidatus Eremiobacteraeota bacterium]|nr:hypothetical protein [Candidatus Eremiobacteraeota bacterium]